MRRDHVSQFSLLQTACAILLLLVMFLGTLFLMKSFIMWLVCLLSCAFALVVMVLRRADRQFEAIRTEYRPERRPSDRS